MQLMLSKRAVKEISKTEKKTQNAIFDYLKSLENYSETEIYEHGAKDLSGNLKGLIRFKDKSFITHRLVGTKKEGKLIIMLCCEPRNKVYKNKEEMARKSQKDKIN